MSMEKGLLALARLFAFSITGNKETAASLVDWAYRTDGETFTDRFLRTDLVSVSASLKKEFIERFIIENGRYNIKEAREAILNMPYRDFLKTPYWKAIAEYVKEQSSNKCSVCGSPKSLHVHHVTYGNHGDELHHLEDLACLCRKCHKAIHGK